MLRLLVCLGVSSLLADLGNDTNCQSNGFSNATTLSYQGMNWLVLAQRHLAHLPTDAPHQQPAAHGLGLGPLAKRTHEHAAALAAVE